MPVPRDHNTASITPAFRPNEFERGILRAPPHGAGASAAIRLRLPRPAKPVGEAINRRIGHILSCLFFYRLGFDCGADAVAAASRGRLGTAMLAGALLGVMGGGRGGNGRHGGAVSAGGWWRLWRRWRLGRLVMSQDGKAI